MGVAISMSKMRFLHEHFLDESNTHPSATTNQNKKQRGGFAFFGYFFGEAKK
jgi:hypothetical protein